MAVVWKVTEHHFQVYAAYDIDGYYVGFPAALTYLNVAVLALFDVGQIDGVFCVAFWAVVVA